VIKAITTRISCSSQEYALKIQIVKERMIYAKPHAPNGQMATMRRSKTLMNSQHIFGGGERDRTDDPLLAKQVLSQLSYTPEN
jgi:hypothetical protein